MGAPTDRPEPLDHAVFELEPLPHVGQSDELRVVLAAPCRGKQSQKLARYTRQVRFGVRAQGFDEKSVLLVRKSVLLVRMRAPCWFTGIMRQERALLRAELGPVPSHRSSLC